MTEFLEQLILNHPVLSTIVFVIGTFRIFFKPIMSAIEEAVARTPTTRDDEWLARLKASPVYNLFAWLVDYFGSIKLPGTFKK